MIGSLLAQTGSVSHAAARAKIDDILSRPEFAQEKPSSFHPLDGFWKWMSDVLNKVFGVSETAAHIMLGIAAALIVAMIVVVAWKAVRTSRDGRRGESQGTARGTPARERHERVADLRARADAARSAGQHLLALRLFFTALVVGLGESGDLEYRDAWTNRELLERGHPKPAVESALAPLLVDLDRKSFGGVIATEHDVDAMPRLVDKLLRTPTTR